MQGPAQIGQSISPPQTNPPAVTAAGPWAISNSTSNQTSDVTAFSDWASIYLSGAPKPSLARGIALAWKRRQAMRELIQNDPERALALAVPFAWRKALPAEVTRYFEMQVDAHGALNVALASDAAHTKTIVYREALIKGQRYLAFVYGSRLSEPSQQNIPLHGIAIGGKLAVHTDSIRILDRAEAETVRETAARPEVFKSAVSNLESSSLKCAVCSQPIAAHPEAVAADLGGETGYFCGVDHAEIVNQNWKLLRSGGSPERLRVHSTAQEAWTHGAKTLLYMRLNFPDDLTDPVSAAAAYDALNSVNDFYTENSYDVTSISPTVTPLLTLPQPKVWYQTNDFGPFTLLDDARAVASQAGFDTANYDLDIACFTSVPTYIWAGLGFIGAKGTWLQTSDAGVTAHELGHNYGLPHANFWDTLTNSSIIGAGTNVEYGNVYDRMGSGNGHFNALFKNALDWLPDSAVHMVSTSGVYRIYPFDTPTREPGRSYAATVRKDYQRAYWLEFRQQFTTDFHLQNGLLLNWSPFSESHGGSELLDTTPGTPGALSDSALEIGQTFSDPGGGVYLTPIQIGASGTDPWIDVQVNLGAFPDNHPPLLSAEVERTNAPIGTLVHFHATATDPDGDALAYTWLFDDHSFSSNNLPWTFKSWPVAGDHVVRCIVSDMKGGRASANAVVTVGAPAGFRITGQVVDTNGVPLEGVRVDNNPANNSPYIGGYTDSDGRYVITGASGDLELFAFRYGFTFTNITWTNPITADSNLLAIDFIATPLPVVSIAAITNNIVESGTAPDFFIISRTGDTSTNLTIGLNHSGSATLSNDYRLQPTLTNGVNYIDIPPGTNALFIALNCIDDSLIEGPETITLTLVDDPAYVPGMLSESTVTIIDDDVTLFPTVSVAASAPSVPENGTDAAQFVFTRDGHPDKDLLVYYTASGTATPGVDYTRLVGVVLIPAGQLSATVQFQPIDDKDVEGDETVVVSISRNPAYNLGASTAQVTIIEDDVTTVTIVPTSDAAAEPSASGRFTVKRNGDLSANLSVYYTVTGTALGGVDYVALSGSAMIPAGAASAEIGLAPRDDTLLEGDESVILTLTTNASYSVGTPSSATLFIRDNELPTVTITAPDSMAAEPGNDFGTFQISRGSVVNGTLTVYLAINGTALSGVDYVPLDSTVTIPDGSSKVTMTVIPFDDLQAEPTEDVRIQLLSSTNYNVGVPDEAVVQIFDDDASNVPAVGFTAAESSAPESLSPGIGVILSSTSSVPITVNYAVIGGTATTADYSLGSPLLTFEPGELAKSIPLQIKNNSVYQPDRTIRLALYDPANATLDGIKIHTYTILDDDSASVTISATVDTVSEGSAVPGNFRISRNGHTESNLLVNFQVTGTASAPADYAPLGTSVIIPAGASQVDIPVRPNDDLVVERSETVMMTLIRAPGATIASPNVATVTLVNNDSNGLPVVTLTSTNAPNAVEGGPNGEFRFSRSTTNGSLVVSFTLGGTASSGVDYVPLSGSVTIPDGQASIGVPVVAIDDNTVQGERTLIASVTAVSSYRVSHPGSATVTIQDNDQRVRVDASDFIASEPGTDTGEFTFTRFGTTNAAVRVFFTIGGTAINGVDYVAIPNSIVIPAGGLSVTLPIVPSDDPLVEGPETVTLTLQSNPAYYLDNPSMATLTLQDDEPMLMIIAPVSKAVESGRTPGVFRIIRTGNPNYSFTAHLGIGGTATFGVDYPAFAKDIDFSCGVMAMDILVSPVNDLLVEGNETITADLLPDPAYSILEPHRAVMQIIDAGLNHAPAVSITSPASSPVFLLGTNVNLILEGSVSDEGDPSTLTNSWSKVIGPDSIIFGDTNQLNTTIGFTNAGVYVLRLTADDGQLENSADLTVYVGAAELLSSNSLYWAFEEGEGTTVIDSSPIPHNGILVGNPAWVTNGVLGGALSFSNANDYVQTTNTTSFLNGLKAFTLSLWIKSFSTNADAGIFCANASSTNMTLSLYSRNLSSCGASTNVIEATIPTTHGAFHLISAAGVTTNDWQHLALVWSEGEAPSLFINGQLDQHLAERSPLDGALTNCPGFFIGRGPAEWPLGWKGLIDEVRFYPYALSTGEVAIISCQCAELTNGVNFGPVVDAGPDQTLQLGAPDVLAGVVTDDGLPNPPAMVLTVWTNLSGPLEVVIPDPPKLTNHVEFTQTGEYVFRLVANDGQVKTYDDVTYTLIEPTRVDVFATDPEASELGPDTGQFTFTRSGDTNFDLKVNLAMSGIASNGVDFVELPYSIIFPAGTDTVEVVVTPYLDHRTEGDQDLTLTIITNLAYSIGNGQATIIIHDSPYGLWNISHFTLEELTLPALSGENADFDHDGLVNFAEYAANLDPKVPDTNPPVVVTIQSDPTNGLPHINITYQRRIQPTDAGYAVSISNDLVTWLSGDSYIEEVQATDDGNNITETVHARVIAPYSNSNTKNQFVTVRVWLRTTQP